MGRKGSKRRGKDREDALMEGKMMAVPEPAHVEPSEDMTKKSTKKRKPGSGLRADGTKKKARRGGGGGGAGAVSVAKSIGGGGGMPGPAPTARDEAETAERKERSYVCELDPETGVSSFPNGVQFIDGKLDAHGQVAKENKPVTIRYRGTVQAEVGRKSIPFAKGMLTWWLGSGQVIAGLDQALRGMRQGGQRKVLIPPGAAYGDQGDGDGGKIPPNATLVFDVELVRVGTKAEELAADEKKEAKKLKLNAGRTMAKASGNGLMAVMGQPEEDEGVIPMPLPSELCRKGRNRTGKPKQISAWREKRRRKSGKTASAERANKRGAGGDFERGARNTGGRK